MEPCCNLAPGTDCSSHCGSVADCGLPCTWCRVQSPSYLPLVNQTAPAAWTNPVPAGAVYKLHDDNNNPLTTEYGLCKYRNHQVITVQELPETAPAGQLPRSAEVSHHLRLHIKMCLHHSACPGCHL